MTFDLEDRLIDFSVLIIDITELLPDRRGSNHLAGQLVHSGTATALIYGEAQSGESRKDFIHKMKVGLKELRETRICLKIIDKKGYLKPESRVKKALDESSELISIFVTLVKTALTNLNKTS